MRRAAEIAAPTRRSIWHGCLFASTEEDGVGTFYWPKHMEPGSAVPYRAPPEDTAFRGVEEICMQELASLAEQIRRQGLSGEDALITMARELGLQRLPAASRGRLEAALVASVESGPTL